MEIRVKIEGIHCGGCLNSLDVKLTELGVVRFDLDLSTRIADIIFDPNNTSISDILDEIRQLGYRIYLKQTLQ